MTDLQGDNSRTWIRNIAAGILGGAIGARYSQDGPLSPPKGSLRAAIYKQGLPAQKRKEALDFLVWLENNDPWGLRRLEGTMTNDELFAMLQSGEPAEWRRSVPRSAAAHVQTTINTIFPPRPKPKWWRTGLKWFCIALVIVLSFWIAFPQLHN